MVERVNVGADIDPGVAAAAAAADAAALEKAEKGVTSIRSDDSRTGESVNLRAQEAKPERPADIPEKFWDAEKGEVNIQALLKAQQDAEAALRSKAPPEKTPEDAPKAPEAGQQSAVDAAAAEFFEKGELSDATYESLAKAGLSRDIVNTYIDGQRAVVEKLQAAAFGEFGGTQESYQEAVKWAADNLSDDEIAALDVQLTSTNPAIVKQGARVLAERYKANADITPSVNLSGDGNVTSIGDYFKSSHELTKAMSDPRYAKDEYYRNQVASKIERAVKAGVKLYG